MHRVTVCSIVLLLLLGSSLLGDVVELKSGERIEGRFKQATSAGVVIEVGGRPITMPLEKVRAIYFGGAPDPTTSVQASPAHDALMALKALQSVTTVGVNYGDYASRVLDTKVKVDQFLQSPKGSSGPGTDAIRIAMRYYEIASQAWSGHLTQGFPKEVGRILEEDEEINACPAIKALVQRKDDFYQKNPSQYRGTRNGRPLPDPDPRHFGFLAELAGQQPAILWRCGSDRMAEAEGLLK